MDIDAVIEATGGTLICTGERHAFEGVCTDSRGQVKKTLFIPLTGAHFDGHDFLREAAARGAEGFLVAGNKIDCCREISDGVTVIAVDDTLRALGDIAHWWRRCFTSPVIAVTGSSGKTTTKEIIATIGNRSMTMAKSRGNYNNLVGLPLSLLGMRAYHGAAVFELGANRPGEIERLTEIAEPDVAVITNVGPAHLAGFGSIETVREEKGRIFKSMRPEGIAVINRDDEHVKILEDRWKGKSLTFGINEQAAIRGERIFSRGERGVSFTLKIGGLARGIDMTTLGRHNIYNALAAAACCWSLGISYEDICEGLKEFSQVPGRMTLYKLENGGALVDDSYNANPASVREALQTLNDLREWGESVVVLGDMLELGDDAPQRHEEVGRFVAATGVSALFVKGAFALSVAEGAYQGGMVKDQVLLNLSPEKMIERLRALSHRDLWILVKGSRGMRMDLYADAIKHEFGLKVHASHQSGGDKTP